MSTDFNRDPEYQELRQQITNKEMKSWILGAVGTVALVGAFFLATGGLGVGGLIAGAISATIGAGVLYTNYRREVELTMDHEELANYRSAKHLGAVFGKDRGQDRSSDLTPQQEQELEYIAASMMQQNDRPSNHWRDQMRERQAMSANSDLPPL